MEISYFLKVLGKNFEILVEKGGLSKQESLHLYNQYRNSPSAKQTMLFAVDFRGIRTLISNQFNSEFKGLSARLMDFLH